jgi:hypothetical protein
LRDYLERHPDASNANDVLNYAAWILINHAVAGLMSNPRQVRELLADPILGQCRFQRRLRLLRWTSAMPERVARAVVRFHTARWAEPWRSLYARLTA